MSEGILNIAGGINSCYIFYMRMADCVRRETFFDLMCKDQMEDYKECKFGTRYRSFRVWMANESKRMKILSFPRYDDKTDSFVDGPLPATADSFFNDEDKLKDFFEIKKVQPHNEQEKQRYV